MGTANSPPIQIISVPVMCNQDAFDTPGNDSLANFPRCVVQLINKKAKGGLTYYGDNPKMTELLRRSNKFTVEDMEKMEKLSYVIGRVHQVVNKVE